MKKLYTLYNENVLIDDDNIFFDGKILKTKNYQK